MRTLSNQHLRFAFDPATGYWNLEPASGESRIHEARLGAIYAVETEAGPRRVYWDGELIEAEVTPVTAVPTAHGPADGLRIQARTSDQWHATLAVTLTFLLPVDLPFLLWRAEVENFGPAALVLELVDLLRVGPRFQPRSGRSGLWHKLRSLFWRELDGEPHAMGPAGFLSLAPASRRPARLAFFSNGYQSWSFAGSLQADRSQPTSRFGPLGEPKALNLVTPRIRRAGRLTSDMFGAIGDREHDRGVVAGFTSQREQFSAVEVLLDRETPSLRLTAQCDQVRLEPAQARATDWAYLQFIQLSTPDGLGAYAEAVARENRARVPTHVPVGWCSWYHYFDRVTEADMLSNLRAIVAERDDLPLDFVQLDDGYQVQVGDWFETKPAFARGLAWLAAEIRAQGLVPGLWLAPYIVRSDARLLREHPDWFLRHPNGRRANAGFNWFHWCYGLDPTHPAVRAHIQRLISTAVHDWGYPYLKLDFLYAAALPAKRYDPTLTRAQAMCLALADIRAAAGPETFLLGCGCPLGPAVGIVDGMRVSTDVAPDWNPHLYTPYLAPLLRREVDFVGVRNAVRNTINRAPLHRRWWLNDPDCLLVRDHDTRLTEPEVRSLASVIGLSGGMFLVSDDMNRLGPDRQRYIAALLPVLGTSAKAPRWLDSEMPDLFVLPRPGAGGLGPWVVAGIFNWHDVPRDREVNLRDLGLDPQSAHWAAEFWEGACWRLAPGASLRLPSIPAHGVRLVALRPCLAAVPDLVGSSLHFSQGGEISQWAVEGRRLTFTIELDRHAEGQIWLALPAPPVAARSSERPAVMSECGPGVYSMWIKVNRTAHLSVTW
ncbi:MAG: alpha-galactosidase [Anaerolineales bacterium]|nr:alpha-galactosidase [Anaerolineales bacterium]